MLDLAERERIDLTIVGPELPLDRGIVDLFVERGRSIFGPTRAAAQLECSKVFSKEFMARHGIPTARYRVCDSAAGCARARSPGASSGFPSSSRQTGSRREKASSSLPIVRRPIERCVLRWRSVSSATPARASCWKNASTGPEVSFFALCDGARAIPLRSAQDHKRIFDDDRGPNTGGMGAFSPSPLLDEALQTQVMREIVEPVLRGLAAEGHPYRGFLYAGLMLTCDGPKVIEFNVRFGDPEAQVVLPAIDGALAPHLIAAAAGRLEATPIPFSRDKLVGVVLASRGYPGSGPTGLPIDGLDAAGALEHVTVFHSGTAERDGRVVTAGGRVLTVVGRGDTFEAAIARAYEGVARIGFEGMQYRRDIGAKARATSKAHGA